MLGASGFGQAPRQDRPAFGTAPIRCGKMKCKWRGYETDLSAKPENFGIGVSGTRNVCPACGCDSYMFMTEKEIAAWNRGQHNRKENMANQKQELQRLVNCRPAEKPPVMPACRNCKYFTYDACDRMGMRGDYIEKISKRCTLNEFNVTSNIVCDKHEFKHADKRDV